MKKLSSLYVQIYPGLLQDKWSRLLWVIEISAPTYTFQGVSKIGHAANQHCRQSFLEVATATLGANRTG